MFHLWHKAVSRPARSMPLRPADEHRAIRHMSVSTITGRQAEILHPKTRSLYQVWDAIRRGKTAPKRDELDLRSIRDLLANVAVIEQNPVSSAYPFRLAGTALRKIFGKELTGTDFLSLWSPMEQNTISDLAGLVISKHQPATVRFKGFARDGRAEGIEMIMLPMIHSTLQETQIIAVIAPLTSPYWLGVHTIIRNELISHRVIRTDPYSGSDTRAQDVFAEKARPLTAPVGPESKPQPIRGPRHYPAPSQTATESPTHYEIARHPRKLHLIRGGMD